MDQLAALKAFLKTAETGSFSAAGRQLKLSKSMISRYVNDLETMLGVRLFTRTTRSLGVTEAGAIYKIKIEQIITDLNAANSFVSQSQEIPQGNLRVNVPVSFGEKHLAPLLPEFSRLYPGIKLELGLNDKVVDLVEEGFDLAVRIGKLLDSSLIAKKIIPIRKVVCASPEYLARRGIPQKPEDLKQHDCFRHTYIGRSEWKFVKNGKETIIDVDGKFQANSGDVIRILALAGEGIAYLPTFFVGKDIREGMLVSILDQFVSQDKSLYVVYPGGRYVSPKIRAFIDFLSGTFGPKPYWD